MRWMLAPAGGCGWMVGLTLGVALTWPLDARAGDGRVPINQAKALAGGVTAGDTPGLPVTISVSGSYYLAGDLSIDENTSAIEITANDVTVDMNGFAIRGPTVCTTAPSCTPTGLGRGIDANGQEGLVVYGGTIDGVGSDGIRAGAAARIEDMSFRNIGDSSVIIGSNSFIRNTRTERVLTGALVCSTQCFAENNAVQIAGGDGIVAQSASIMRNNSIEDVVTGIDFSTGIGGVLEGNSVYVASSFGLLSSGGVLVGNTINNAGVHGIGGFIILGVGNVIQGSGSQGYQGGGLFFENTIQNNGSWGLELTDGGYGNNVLNDNNGGAETQVSGGAASNQLSSNICQVDLSCP